MAFNKGGQGQGGWQGNRGGGNYPPREEVPQIQGKNQIMLVGYLANDPELKYTTTGMAYFKGSVGVPSVSKDGRWNKSSFRIVAFAQVAEMLGNATHKGTWVKVLGSLKNNSFKKPDGTTQWSTDIIVSKFMLVDENDGFSEILDDSGNAPAPQPQPQRQASRPQAAPQQQAPPPQRPAPQQRPVAAPRPAPAPPVQEAAPIAEGFTEDDFEGLEDFMNEE